MSNLNDVKLQGRIVRDAVLKTSTSGLKIALFTLAVNQTKKESDGTYSEYANYFPISMLVKSEKFCDYLKKGQQMILEGYLKQVTQDLGTTDANGKHRYDSRTYICSSKVHLIFEGKKNEDKQPIELPDNNLPATDDVIIETENTSEDIFVGDNDSSLF
jgi:single stranded DNA-binding protein